MPTAITSTKRNISFLTSSKCNKFKLTARFVYWTALTHPKPCTVKTKLVQTHLFCFPMVSHNISNPILQHWSHQLHILYRKWSVRFWGSNWGYQVSTAKRNTWNINEKPSQWIGWWQRWSSLMEGFFWWDLGPTRINFQSK